MDEATIKQMMVEYKQAMDKANFLEREIKQAVIKIKHDVQTDYMLCKYYDTSSRFGEPWAFLIVDLLGKE